MKVTILETLGFTSLIGFIAAIWRTGQDRGMVVAIISMACLAYYMNRLRSKTPIVPTTLLALPMIAIGVFVFALVLGLRHPPFMVPPGWEWPPFASLQERIVHAFALAIWTFIFGTPMMLLLGTIRRLCAALTLTPRTATNK